LLYIIFYYFFLNVEILDKKDLKMFAFLSLSDFLGFILIYYYYFLD